MYPLDGINNFLTPYRRRKLLIPSSGYIGDTTMYLSSITAWPGYAGNFSWHGQGNWLSNILFSDLHAGSANITTITTAGENYRWRSTDL